MVDRHEAASGRDIISAARIIPPPPTRQNLDRVTATIYSLPGRGDRPYRGGPRDRRSDGEINDWCIFGGSCFFYLIRGVEIEGVDLSAPGTERYGLQEEEEEVGEVWGDNFSWPLR